MERYSEDALCRGDCYRSITSQGESYDDLEILDILEFLIIFLTRGVGEVISAKCKIFYPVAFFLGAFKGTRCYDVIICTSRPLLGGNELSNTPSAKLSQHSP